jgi:hypothetical protein
MRREHFGSQSYTTILHSRITHKIYEQYIFKNDYLILAKC